MSGHITKGLDEHTSAVTAALSGAAAAGILTALAAIIAQRRTFVVWCRQFLLANLGGYGIPGLFVVSAAVMLGAVAALAAAWFVLRETRRRNALSRRLRMLGTVSSGKLSAAAAGMAHRVTVVDDAAQYAFTKGLLFPRIYVSRGMVSMLTGTELRAVLRHEAYHARRRHPLQAVVMGMLERCFFFVPSFKDVSAHLAVAREVHADSATGDRRAIASALSRIASPVPSFVDTLGAAHFSRIGERVRALAAGDDSVELRLSVARLATSAIAMLMIVSATLYAAHAAHAQQTSRAAGFYCPAPEQVHKTCIDLSPFLKLNVEGPMTRAVQSPYVDLTGL